MAIDWKDPEVKDRLLAAVIASFGSSINCREVARLFGDGATYNAIENFLRVPKRAAAKLKETAGETAAPSPSRPRTPASKKTKSVDGEASPLKSVKSGRVSKTPRKPKGTGSPVKQQTKAEDIMDIENGMDGGISGLDADAEDDGEI